MTDLKLTIRTDSSMIRNLCIKEQYDTNGTISEYEKLLTFVNEHKYLNEKNLEWIAQDILYHSCYFDETKENIKFKILNDACYIIHEKKKPTYSDICMYKGYCIDYIDYRKLYRVFKPERPQDTVAYTETIDEAVKGIDKNENKH